MGYLGTLTIELKLRRECDFHTLEVVFAGLISRLDLVVDILSLFDIFNVSGCRSEKSFGAKVYEHRCVKNNKNMIQQKSCKKNNEKGPGTCFPLKEENLRLPSSAEACRFLIESKTPCVPEARWRIFM